jgi:hypothetical protein
MVHRSNQSFSTSDGIPTTVCFGFLRSLAALLEQEQPAALAVAFDAPAKSFRCADRILENSEVGGHEADSSTGLRTVLCKQCLLLAASCVCCILSSQLGCMLVLFFSACRDRFSWLS